MSHKQLYKKVMDGERIHAEEALDLFSWNLIDLGKCGDARRKKIFPKEEVGFIIDRIINFTTSCAIAGVIGGFYAHFMCIITPEFLHTKHTIEILFIAFIGGRGSVWGGLVCAFFLIPALEFARPIVEWRFVIYGVMMIVIMIFMPEGIAPHITRAVDAVKARITPSGQRETV